jgi:hypothetical protein
VNIEDRLKLIEGTGISSAGKRNLIRHLKGERLTQRQAIIAKCCDCMGYHADGRQDCRMPHCSLYPFRPYKEDPAVSSGKAISPEIRPPATRLSDPTPRKRGNGRKAVQGG